MAPIQVQVVSDLMCPWCLVGKVHLERAIAQRSDKHNFVVSWIPFQLDPHTPRRIGRKERYEAKFGPERAKMLTERMKQVGKSVGVDFAFGGDMGNSLDGHRVIRWVGDKYGPEKQNAVVDALFRAQFEREKNLAEPATLIEAAVSVGIDEKAVSDFVNDDELTEEVRATIDKTARMASGVPLFIVNGAHRMSGAQPVEEFLDLFDTVAEIEGEGASR